MRDKIFHAVSQRYIEAHLKHEWFGSYYRSAVRQYS